MSSMLWPSPNSQNTVKMTAIGLWKNQKHPFLNHFEEMLGFCLAAKVSQGTDVVVKDLISGGDKYTPPHSPTHQDLALIAKQTQAQAVLYGDLAIPGPEPLEHQTVNQLKIVLKLYAKQQGEMVWEQTIHFQDFLLELPGQNRLIINIEQFNALIAELSREILVTLLPEYPIQHIERLSNIPLTTSYFSLASLLAVTKKTNAQEKILFLMEALKEDPKCELAYYQLGKIYRSERQYEHSIVNYRKALESCFSGSQTQAIYATDAGIACALLERNDLALQWWQRAIQLYPDFVNPYFNIANLYEDQNDNLNAADYFQKAQKVAPGDFRTFYNLARIYAKLNDWDKALNQYQKQLDDNNKDPWCHSDIATCYLNLGDIENATVHLEKTVDLDPAGEAGEYAKLILSNLLPA